MSDGVEVYSNESTSSITKLPDENSIESIKLTFYVGLTVGAVFLVLFECLRGRNNRMCRSIYRQRSSLRYRKINPRLRVIDMPKYPYGILAWIYKIYNINDEQFLHQVGLDGYVAMRFIRFCRRLCFCASLFGLGILTPLYITGPRFSRYDKSVFFLTMRNLEDSSNKLWATVCFAWIFTLYFLFELKSECLHFSDLRNDWLANGDLLSQRQAAYSIMVENIPPSFRSPVVLADFFNSLYPNQVFSVSVCLNLDNIRGLISKRDRALRKLRKASIVSLTKGHDSKIKTEKRFLFFGGREIPASEFYGLKVAKLNQMIIPRLTSKLHSAAILETMKTEHLKQMHKDQENMALYFSRELGLADEDLSFRLKFQRKKRSKTLNVESTLLNASTSKSESDGKEPNLERTSRGSKRNTIIYKPRFVEEIQSRIQEMNGAYKIKDAENLLKEQQAREEYLKNEHERTVIARKVSSNNVQPRFDELKDKKRNQSKRLKKQSSYFGQIVGSEEMKMITEMREQNDSNKDLREQSFSSDISENESSSKEEGSAMPLLTGSEHENFIRRSKELSLEIGGQDDNLNFSGSLGTEQHKLQTFESFVTMINGAKRIVKRHADNLKGGALKGVQNVAEAVKILTIGSMSATAFVTFKTLGARASSVQSLIVSQPMLFNVKAAPEPRDIIWVNVTRHIYQIQCRKTLIKILVALGLIFWASVVAGIQALTLPQTLDVVLPGIEKLSEQNEQLSNMLANYLPVVLMIILMQNLYFVFKMLAKRVEGYKSESEVERAVMDRYLYFQLANVYVSVTAGSILKATEAIIKEPSAALTLLGGALPNVAVYFTNLVLTKVMIGLMTELSFGGRALKFFRILCVEIFTDPMLRTPQGKTEGAYEPTEPWYGRIFNDFLLVMMIVFVYQCIAPFIAPIGLIFFIMATVVYKYQMLHCYFPMYESGGQFFFKLHRQMVIGSVAGLVTLIGYMSIRKGYEQGPFLVPLPFLVLFYGLKWTDTSTNPSALISLDKAAMQDKEDELAEKRGCYATWETFDETAYQQMELKEALYAETYDFRPLFDGETSDIDAEGQLLFDRKGNIFTGDAVDDVEAGGNRQSSNV